METFFNRKAHRRAGTTKLAQTDRAARRIGRANNLPTKAIADFPGSAIIALVVYTAGASSVMLAPLIPSLASLSAN